MVQFFGQPLEMVCSARVVISGFLQSNRQTKLVQNYYSIICMVATTVGGGGDSDVSTKISNDSIFRYSRMGNVYCYDYGCYD